MSVLENFKNIPRSPYGGRQGSNVIFFLQICNEVPGEKKRGGLSPLLRATGGPVAPPPHGRPGQAAYIRPPPHSLLSFDLKKSKKIQKKERGEKKGSGEALPNSALVIYR